MKRGCLTSSGMCMSGQTSHVTGTHATESFVVAPTIDHQAASGTFRNLGASPLAMRAGDSVWIVQSQMCEAQPIQCALDAE